MEKHIAEKSFQNLSADLQACNNQVKRLSNCIKIANLINSELSIGKLLNTIMETTKEAFKADAASLLLTDEKTGDLTFQVALGDVGEEIKEIYRLKKGEGIAGFVAQTGNPVNLKDVYTHPEFSPDYDKKTHYRAKAMLCVPLKTHGKIVGVIQVINKLVDPFVFSNQELEILITISSSAAVAIETAKMHQYILQQKTLERDLKLAKEVQQNFLPKELPNIKGYEFSAVNQPALEIGGDFYNFFKLSQNKIGIVLGDVSGKGISASLFMAMLTSDLQYYALLHPEPEDLLNKINTILCERAKRGMFVTLIYMLLDTEKKVIQFANAGHLSPVYADGKETRLIGSNDAKGPPLGILPDVQYKSEEFELKKNCSLTLYTDGIIEAKNSAGQLYGTQRLLKEIGKQLLSPETLIESIISDVDKFSQTQGQSDDLTLLNFKMS